MVWLGFRNRGFKVQGLPFGVRFKLYRIDMTFVVLRELCHLHLFPMCANRMYLARTALPVKVVCDPNICHVGIGTLWAFYLLGLLWVARK